MTVRRLRLYRVHLGGGWSRGKTHKAGSSPDRAQNRSADRRMAFYLKALMSRTKSGFTTG
jgi:hypothetical protein